MRTGRPRTADLKGSAQDTTSTPKKIVSQKRVYKNLDQMLHLQCRNVMQQVRLRLPEPSPPELGLLGMILYREYQSSPSDRQVRLVVLPTLHERSISKLALQNQLTSKSKLLRIPNVCLASIRALCEMDMALRMPEIRLAIRARQVIETKNWIPQCA